MTATIIHLPTRARPAETPRRDACPEITWLFLPLMFGLAWWEAGLKLWTARP